MKKVILSTVAAVSFAVGSADAQLFSDALGDIDASFGTAGNGTLDILSTEVSRPGSDLIFNITVNGNVSTTDWGNFMVGIATGGAGDTSANGNGWGRPISLNSPVGGMNYWIGSWVNSGGGAQLWSYDGTAWTQAPTGPAVSLTAGTSSQISLTLPFANIGSPGGTWYFDVYSSGSGPDSAVDALSNPNIAITTWAGPYSSSENPPGTGISAVPEPSTYALLGLGALALGGYAARRRARK